MSKKIFSYSVVVVLIISLIANSVVFAAPYSYRYGQVTSVSPRGFTIINLNKVSQTILVKSSTNFYGVDGRRRSLSYLTAGTWVFASGMNDSFINLAANDVVITGPLYTSGDYWNYPSEFGRVTSVDPASRVFSMNTAASDQVNVIFYSRTVYRSQIKDIVAVNPGMQALVAGPTLSNGYILARIVILFNVN